MNLAASFRELLRYRWLLEQLIIRDLKLKYRRSVLGYLWSVLNPLMMMAILTVVFSQMFRFDIPDYPVYLLAGQLIYGFYAEATGMAMQSIVGGASLLKKVYFPKYIFPLSRVLSSFTTMCCSLLALFLVMAVCGISLHATLVLLPVILFEILLFCVGMGLLLSAYVVFFRDIRHFYGVFLTGMNYLTPIFYPVGLLPEWLRRLMPANPLYDFITFFREAVIYGKWPAAELHLLCAGYAAGMLLLGLYIFRKKQDDFILYI